MFKSLRGMSFPNVVQTQMVRVLHIYIIYITLLRLLAFAHIMEEFSFSLDENLGSPLTYLLLLR